MRTSAPTPFVPLGHFPLTGGIGPYSKSFRFLVGAAISRPPLARQLSCGRIISAPTHNHRACAKKPHPAIVSNPGALLNKGSRKLTSTTAERQRAGKGALPQVSTRAGQVKSRLPFRMAPPGPGPQPRRTLVTFLRGTVTRPQAEHPRPRPSQRAKFPTLSINLPCNFSHAEPPGNS